MPRHVPTPTPETEHFWEGTRAGELRLQRCTSCSQHYFPPRPWCPHCSSADVEVVEASGDATLYSYVIVHRGMPWMEAPYVVAVVELAEGPRMMTNIVGCPPEPEALPLDLALRVRFESISDEISLPLFEPAEAAS
jgi:uncharacterized OB-fold protein